MSPIARQNTSPRPPHRPSRRHVVVDGAMALFATSPVDEVTVQEIATAVAMTPAAVYYHFASKEQILTEGMQQFRDALLAEIRATMPGDGDLAGLRNLFGHALTWTDRQRPQATVYFVSSIGLNTVVEALRRETRLELVEVLRDAVKAVRGRLDDAEAGVVAVALVSLLETSAASMLNRDAAYTGLGARRFVDEVGQIADRIAGVPPAG